MFDAAIRSRLEKPLSWLAGPLARVGVAPNMVTGVGFIVGVGACVSIAYERWWLGLTLWILNRLADGLDGPIARRQGPTELGGFFDIVADFAVYGGVLIALGIALPDTRMASLVVFLTYYLSGSSFLAFSSLAATRALEGDGRSLNFPAGIVEGAETIAVYIVILAFPSQAVTLLWIWAALVGLTALQRVLIVARLLQ